MCNHLSLFLCVADYDKLLPGWSHFAQFTIAVANKDPKKSKYSDTLHRFCKKEHDWGWKKFMELSKVLDGFTVSDTLVIKAQVQVIRENPHRPLRYLDCQYRRELVRVYLTNVEGICRRFVEEKRDKIGKLMEDTVRWSSFRAFWSAVEGNVRCRLSREKKETILKAIVKWFFNEKEVTSTLVMDALYSGCKALDHCSKNKKGKINGVEVEETVNPVVGVDKDFFVLSGDVLLLLERAANESLPPYKEDKGPQNRTKDGGPGDDFGKDSIERDEKRLTELGRRTVEMFVLAHLFSNRVEVAYREAIALKRQEELIREEEAAGQAEIELKAKREAAEKEKRTKKKQAKQRRNNRKENEKVVEEKHISVVQDPRQRDDSTSSTTTRTCLLKGPSNTTVDLGDEDDDLSVLDTNDNIVGTLGPAVEDGDADHALWEREGSETNQVMEASFSGSLCVNSAQDGRSDRKHQALLDDSSSTCSSDSIPSLCAASNGSSRRRLILPDKNDTSINRGRGRADKNLRLAEADGIRSGRSGTAEASSSCSSGTLDAETVIASLKQQVQWLKQRLTEKEEEVVMLHEQISLYHHHFGSDISIYTRKSSDSGDCHPGLGTGDRAPLSPSSRGKGELSNNRGKADEESQEIGRVFEKGAVVANGSAVHADVSSKMNGVGHSGMNVLADSGGQQKHSLSMLDSIRPPATSCSGSLNACECETCAPIAFIPLTGMSEVSGPMSHSVLSTSLATETGLSRPSSAPGLVADPREKYPILHQLQPAPPLGRSVSATGRLGITSIEHATSTSAAVQQSTPITLSYRNTGAGVIQNNNTMVHPGLFVSTASGAGIGSAERYPQFCSGYTQRLSQPMSVPSSVGPSLSSIYPRKIPISGQGAPSSTDGEKDEMTCHAAVPNVSGNEEGVFRGDAQPSERSQKSMGFTFGTVTPEILHLQHQQLECADGGQERHVHSQDYFQDEHLRHRAERDNGKEPQNCAQLEVNSQKYNPKLQQHLLHVPTGTSTTLPAMQIGAEIATRGAVLSEEFPHLDIINELLEDDKVFGAKTLNSFLLQPGNQGFNHHLSFQELQKILSGQLHPEMNSVHHNGSGRSNRNIPCDDGISLQLPNPPDCTFTGYRESIQLLHPFTHPLPHSFNQHGGAVDGIFEHHWPGAHGDMPITSGPNGVQSGMDLFIGYPMQSPHIPIADGPTFTLGQNGYTMYSPMKHP